MISNPRKHKPRSGVAAAVLCLAHFALSTSPAFSAEPAGNAAPADAASFGTRMAEAFNNRDAVLLKKLFDPAAFGRRAAALAFEDASMRDGFAHGVGGAGFDKRLAVAFRQLQETDGIVRFMRVKGANPGKPIIRFDFHTSGVDYWEILINKQPDGSYRGVDWFQVAGGQMASRTAGEVGQLLANPDRGLLERLFGPQIDAEAVDKLRRVADLNTRGRYADSLAILKSLPESMGKSRPILMSRVSLAAMSKSDAEHRAALAILARQFGDDSSLALLLMDHYFYLHQTEKALGAVAMIEGRVGVDGVTSVFRVGIYADGKDYARALEHAKAAVQLEPERYDGYQALGQCYILNGKYPDAVETFRKLEQQFGFQFERAGFAADPTYAEFMKSPAFREWLPK